MSGEKPAPTAEEIAAAREWLDDVTLDILLADGHERTVGHVRTLLAALDAAEALEKAAEDKLARACALADRTAASHVETRSRAETAERERDELSDALKLYEAFPELATGDTARRDEQRAAYNGLRWVLGLLAGLDDGRQDSVAKAFRPVVEKIKRERDEARAALKPGAIVVSDSEETRERIARALWDGEGYSEPWGESARNSHPVTYRCVLRDTNAVLAALREVRP